MSRVLIACAAGLLLVLGIWDLGLRADAAELSMAECLRPQADCDGALVQVPQHRIEAVEGGVVVLQGRGYRVALVGIAEADRSDSRLAYVSAAGIWGPGARVQVERALLHRFGRIKLAVGAISLAVVLGVGFGFVVRRARG